MRLAAHPNGTSKVSIHLIDPDSITVTVAGKTDDFCSTVGVAAIMETDPQKRREKTLLYQIKVADYLQARVRLKLDGRLVENLKVIRWKPNGKGPEDGLDSADLWISSQQITLGGALPSRRENMDVSVQLFAEFGIEPISEISVIWKDSVLLRKWTGPDRPFRFPVARDSLVVLLDQARHAGSTVPVKTENVVLRFIGLGFTHILPLGLDHILFVLGLFFFSTRMKPLLWQVTAFTVAHSITLGLSLVGVVSLPSRVVEPLIALSIAVVGIENIFFRELKASRWLIVFCFGLVHGLGFAGALREFGLPPGKFWSTLAGFNFGVELGQLAVITAAFTLTRWMWNRPWYFKRVVIPASAAITMVALYWVVRRSFGI